MKITKIILLNIFIILIVFLSLEYYMACKWADKRCWGGVKYNFIKDYKNILFHSMDVDTYFDKMLNGEHVENTFSPAFRQDWNVNSKLKPILFMGCSFTYGDNLPEEETISAKTAKLTGRPVYNRAGRGWGLDQYLYLSRRNDFYTKIPEPEYIIYIYMCDHINRISKFKIQPISYEFQPKYKLKNNKLVEMKPKFYDRFLFVQVFQYRYNYIIKKITENELIEKYFTEAQAEFKKHWPNSKLVILLFPIVHNKGPLDKSFIWNDLRKKGFIVIDLTKYTNYQTDFTSDEYLIDGWHPNAKVWDIFLPEVLNELNIKKKKFTYNDIFKIL